jgi:hypothetical protein
MNEILLSQFASSTYSQFGEDGIILEILNRLEKEIPLSKWCVDVGAHNGVDLSNTCKFIRELGFQAVLIEGDKKQIPILKRNFPQGVVCVGEFVGIYGELSIDSILSKTGIPTNFDLLSLDIDGMDYWVWDSINLYKPKIVCIEFNFSVPNAVEFIQEKNFNIKHGSSAKSFVKLAESKGYCLVASTKSNLIFVDDSIVQFVQNKTMVLEDCNFQGNDPQYIFAGYDGTLLSNKNSVVLTWHFEFPLSKIQILPKILRKYRGDYGFIRKIIFISFIISCEPFKIYKRLNNRMRRS